MNRTNRTRDCSFWLWMGAIATGAGEVLISLAAGPDGFRAAMAHRAAELGVRLAAYALLFGLAWAMVRSVRWSRSALFIIFGCLGTFSLVFEPVQWLAEGGDPVALARQAGAAGWGMAVFRAAHLLCVLAASVWMLLPSNAEAPAVQARD